MSRQTIAERFHIILLSINAVSFLAWVTQFLVTTSRRGHVVVMDNLSSHKATAVRGAI